MTLLLDFWANVSVQANAAPLPLFSGLPVSGDCWLWNGPRKVGYGHWHGAYAHRVAASIYMGGKTPGKVTIKCRNPLCVARTHLSISMNVRQPIQRYSKVTGRPLTVSLASDPDVIESIRRAHRGNWRASAIANVTGHSVALIRTVLHQHSGLWAIMDEVADLLRKGIQPIEGPNDRRIPTQARR
jgi:hypothetical protein